jgi:hypothetical protein
LGGSEFKIFIILGAPLKRPGENTALYQNSIHAVSTSPLLFYSGYLLRNSISKFETFDFAHPIFIPSKTRLTLPLPGDIPDNQGNEFVLAFMQNDIHSAQHTKQHPELYITTESPNVVKVNVTLPLMKDVMADKFLEVTRGKVIQVTLPDVIRTDGTKIEKKGKRLKVIISLIF